MSVTVIETFTFCSDLQGHRASSFQPSNLCSSDLLGLELSYPYYLCMQVQLIFLSKFESLLGSEAALAALGFLTCHLQDSLSESHHLVPGLLPKKLRIYLIYKTRSFLKSVDEHRHLLLNGYLHTD
jgi:hypothetical protein